jgi:hypothetical protein
MIIGHMFVTSTNPFSTKQDADNYVAGCQEGSHSSDKDAVSFLKSFAKLYELQLYIEITRIDGKRRVHYCNTSLLADVCRCCLWLGWSEEQGFHYIEPPAHSKEASKNTPTHGTYLFGCLALWAGGQRVYLISADDIGARATDYFIVAAGCEVRVQGRRLGNAVRGYKGVA